MKRHSAGRKLLLAFFLLPLVFLLSCEKDPDLVGLDVTPSQDQLFVNVIDTFTITAYTVAEDSIASGYTSLNLLGSSFDPVFGKVNCGFVSQVLLSSANPSFGNSPVMDSLVLILAYNKSYGDTNTLQTIHVYELDEDLRLDSTYFSNHQVKHKGVDYAHLSLYPHPTDSLLVDTSKLPPLLRVNIGKIRPDLANKILYTPAGNLASNTEFLKYFKGIYVSADPVSYNGAILYFNLLSPNTRFRLYYHNATEDSLHYDLVINEAAVRFNCFDHYHYDFGSQAFRRQVVYKDTTLGNQLLYLQSMSGTKIRLKFPYLKKWAEQHKIAINEAQLILPVNDDAPGLAPVTKIAPVLLNENGKYYNLPDAADSTYMGGSYKAGSNAYKFRITQYVQNILKENYVDYGMYLLASRASARANHVVLTGAKHPTKPLKLRITYSYLK